MHLLRQFERETLRVRSSESMSKNYVVDHDKRERRANIPGTINVNISQADATATSGMMVGVREKRMVLIGGKFRPVAMPPKPRIDKMSKSTGKSPGVPSLLKTTSMRRPVVTIPERSRASSRSFDAKLPFGSPARKAAGRRAKLTNSARRSVPIMDSKLKNPVRVGLVKPSARVGPIFYQDESGSFCSGHYDVPLCPVHLKGDAYKAAISPYRDFRTFTTERAKQGLPVCKEQYKTTGKYVVRKKRYQRYGLNRKEKRKNWFKDKVLKVILEKTPAISKSKLSSIRHEWSVSRVKLPPSVLKKMVEVGSKSCKIRDIVPSMKFDMVIWSTREPFDGPSLNKRVYQRYVGTPRKRSSFNTFDGFRPIRAC